MYDSGMGSNQNRSGDKKSGGGSEWGSKGRKEANLSKKHQLHEAAIEDSLASNTVDRGLEIGLDMAAEEGWNTTPPRKKRRGSKKWCRRKEGREHKYIKIRDITSWFRAGGLAEYRCEACGHKKYTRGGQQP